MHTCKNDQAVAGLGVAEDAATQQHVLVAQGVFLVSPVQSPIEAVQLVVGWLTHHLALTHNIQCMNEPHALVTHTVVIQCLISLLSTGKKYSKNSLDKTSRFISVTNKLYDVVF